MACDAQSLLDSAACFMCLSEKQLMAITAYEWCVKAGGGGGGANERITEEGDTRVTEEGDTRVIE